MHCRDVIRELLGRSCTLQAGIEGLVGTPPGIVGLLGGVGLQPAPVLVRGLYRQGSDRLPALGIVAVVAAVLVACFVVRLNWDGPTLSLHLPIDQAGANLFFQLISRRYEKGPVILTSNQSFGSWGEVFGDRIIATAILGRVLHHAITINIRGNSYRLKDKLKAGLIRVDEPAVN